MRLLSVIIVVAGVLGSAVHARSADRDAAEVTVAGLQTEVESLREEVEALRGLMTDLTAQVSRTRPAIASLRLPDTLTLAGTPVPLQHWDVGERLEREFYLALAQPAQVVLWLKRSARYFPYIEERLREAGLPDDLKYVAVAESALMPRAYSWAHASGIWQFIPETGRRYGLRVTAGWDERRDPERSTAAAIAYLKDLHAQFRDWPLALAAYNAGEGRVAAALRAQGVSEYYRLVLPAETERYVFRILAAKLILEAPDHYGFNIAPEERYAPRPTDVVVVPVTRSVGVRELATAAGSFYREIKALNPAIMDHRLSAGRYDVRVPEGAGITFAARVPTLQRTTSRPPVNRLEYRIKAGDTLVEIAKRFRVSVADLQKWNTAARRNHIYPGTVLVIERPGR